MRKYSPMFGLSAEKFTDDGVNFNYRSKSGQRFRVRKIDVVTVAVGPAKGFGKSVVKVVGHGTVLGETGPIPTGWAIKAQEFIQIGLDQMAPTSPAQPAPLP